MKTLSICIPTYEMRGLGVQFLEHSFDILARQSFKDFDIVISDHSQNEDIKYLCEKYKNKLDIHYFKNTENLGSSASNINNAICKATGRLIKILFQDDFLFNENSLLDIVQNFDLEKDHWMVTACEHSRDGISFFRPFYPKYNNKMHLGNNTISSPSVLTIKNDSPILFDENLIWLMDCDYYRRCYDKFGSPKILNKISVVNRIGKHQITNTLADYSLRRSEHQYMIEKFGKKSGPLYLPNVTLVAISSVKIDQTIQALKKSMQGIVYGRVLFLTDVDIDLTKDNIEVIKINKLDYDGYSHFVIYKLKDYIKTDFALITQHDGYALRPNKWLDEFLDYDYIGAPWRKGLYFTQEGINIRVGNGGFSLRSKKLLEAPTKLNIPFEDNGTGFLHEDGIICLFNHKVLTDYGIKFAPVNIAGLFSRERWCIDSSLFPFGFHNNRKNIFRVIINKIKKFI